LIKECWTYWKARGPTVEVYNIVLKGNPISQHMSALQQKYLCYDPEVFYLASYTGDYFLSSALVIGKYLRDSEKLDWRNPAELSGIMRDCYVTAFNAFTGRKKEIQILAEVIDWE